MKREEFNTLVQERIDKIEVTLASKGKEYSTDKDVFHTFKRAGQIANITPERALYGFLLKHLTSFSDILDNIDKRNYPTIELLEEKAGDIINYYILLEALIKENVQLIKSKEQLNG